MLQLLKKKRKERKEVCDGSREEIPCNLQAALQQVHSLGARGSGIKGEQVMSLSWIFQKDMESCLTLF